MLNVVVDRFRPTSSYDSHYSTCTYLCLAIDVLEKGVIITVKQRMLLQYTVTVHKSRFPVYFVTTH